MPAKHISKPSSVSKKGSWRYVQSKTKSKERTKLALIVLALVVGLLFLSWAIRFTQTLFSPREATAAHRSYLWQGKFNINLVIRTPALSLLSYNPQEGKIVLLDLPDETFVEVPNGFGTWQLGSVYGLGQSALLKETVASFLAIPVDGYLDFSSFKKPIGAAQVIADLRKNPFSGLDLLPVLKTDLTMWELIRLKMGINAVRFDKIAEINLAKLNVLGIESLPDGTTVYNPDPVKLDSVLSDFVDPVIAGEHKSIAIFNATDKPQLAQKWARLITNLGGNVIITSNAAYELQNTQVVGEQSQTLVRLKQIFDLGCQNNPKCAKISSTDEDLTSSRAAINVFLGEDYINK